MSSLRNIVAKSLSIDTLDHSKDLNMKKVLIEEIE